MPLFFVIAGYFIKGEKVEQYIRKSVNRLILPYFFTAGVLIVCRIAADLIHGATRYTIKDCIVSLICGYGFPYKENIISFGALWFLPAIFCANCIFNILLRCVNNERILALTCAGISLTGLIIAGVVYLPFDLDIGIYALLFEYVGHFLKVTGLLEKEPQKMRCELVGAIILYSVGLLLYSYDLNTRLYKYPLFSIAAAISGSLLFLVLYKIISEFDISAFLSWCGKNSLTFLCLHILEHTIIPWHKLGVLGTVYLLRIICKIILISLGTIVVSKTWGIRKIYGYN